MTEIDIDKNEMHRRAKLSIAKDYADRLEKVRAGTHDHRDATYLFERGSDELIAYLEASVAYWTARALGAEDDGTFRVQFDK